MSSPIPKSLALTGCLIYFAIFAASWFIAAKAFEYSLYVLFGTDAPWYADLIGGIVLNAANIPLAIICWIIAISGVPTPLWG